MCEKWTTYSPSSMWTQLIDRTLKRLLDGWKVRVYPSRHRARSKARAYIIKQEGRRIAVEHIPTVLFTALQAEGLLVKETNDDRVEVYVANSQGPAQPS